MEMQWVLSLGSLLKMSAIVDFPSIGFKRRPHSCVAVGKRTSLACSMFVARNGTSFDQSLYSQLSFQLDSAVSIRSTEILKEMCLGVIAALQASLAA